MTRLQRNLLRAVKAAPSCGETDDRLHAEAILWLRGFFGQVRTDFKIVIRLDRDTGQFIASLCYGICGHSAPDYNRLASVPL